MLQRARFFIAVFSAAALYQIVHLYRSYINLDNGRQYLVILPVPAVAAIVWYYWSQVESGLPLKRIPPRLDLKLPLFVSKSGEEEDQRETSSRILQQDDNNDNDVSNETTEDPPEIEDDKIVLTLQRRWVPWFFYSSTIAALIGLSIWSVTLGDDDSSKNSHFEYIVLLGILPVNYYFLTNLECRAFAIHTVAGGTDSAVDVIGDFMDGAQLLLLLIDPEKKSIIPPYLQVFMVVFSCVNFVTPTILLGELVPGCLERFASVEGFYTIVDKVGIDLARMVIRIILIADYKAGDEDILEMFLVKNVIVIVVAGVPFLAPVYNWLHGLVVEPNVGQRGLIGFLSDCVDTVSPNAKISSFAEKREEDGQQQQAIRQRQGRNVVHQDQESTQEQPNADAATTEFVHL